MLLVISYCQCFPADFLVPETFSYKYFSDARTFSLISISVKLLMLKSLRIPPYLNDSSPSSRELEGEGGEGFYIA